MTDAVRTQLICDLTELSNAALSVIPGSNTTQLKQLLDVVERSEAAAEQLRESQGTSRFLSVAERRQRPN